MKLGCFCWFFGQWFSAHGFLILVLELVFQRLENTLYFIINGRNNIMKETKRMVKL